MIYLTFYVKFVILHYFQHEVRKSSKDLGLISAQDTSDPIVPPKPAAVMDTAVQHVSVHFFKDNNIFVALCSMISL